MALGKVGTPIDAEALTPLLRDPSAWVRRGAVYALGQLGATDSLAEIRAALNDPDPEVHLAAIWALGHLRDSVSAPAMIQLLRVTRPHGVSLLPTLMEGDGAVRLVSDADARLFDALVQAVGSLAVGPMGPSARRALATAKRRLPDAELDRPARLPTPLGSGEGPRTLRNLFDSPELDG
jgi:HEAT repeat protein